VSLPAPRLGEPRDEQSNGEQEEEGGPFHVCEAYHTRRNVRAPALATSAE
jgi:hypothetical protein